MLKISMLLLLAVLTPGVGMAQSDGGQKKKKMKTEQTQSSIAKRQQEAEANRKQEEEIRMQQEAETKRKREEEIKHEEAVRVLQEAESKRLHEKEIRQHEEKARLKTTTGIINGHEWVDLGLSVKWAICNVGASYPEDAGDLLAWGETTPKKKYKISKDPLNFDNMTIDSAHDAARINWSGSWRMPYESEWRELIDQCVWSWTEQDGRGGYIIIGPNGASIFLPVTGYRHESSHYEANTGGYYWSSSQNGDTTDSFHLKFNENDYNVEFIRQGFGQSVRPVSE